MKKSTFFKGALAVAGIGVGILCVPAGAAILAYMGVAAATTTAGAVGWGILGAIGGGIGGGIVGKIVSLPGTIFFGRKIKKAVEKHGPDLLGNDSAFSTAAFPKVDLKAAFATTGQDATQKTAPARARRNILRLAR